MLDTYHARDYQQGNWPRTGRGVVGVPLFTHVYHDFLHGYGGDSCGVIDRPSPTALYQPGMNPVCGKTPGVAVWSRWFDPSSVDDAQRRMLAGHFDLWHGPAREFLVFGRRMTSPALDGSPVKLDFWNWRSKTSTTLELPGILHSVWELPDGRRGCVFAWVASKPVSLKIFEESLTLQRGEATFRLEPRTEERSREEQVSEGP